ncbi:unnamed protein product [Caenorhabditis auriculariae]|uniref:DNA repair and recombination protein RAD54-like n=1 Tax=Caenorhabditis auriculariae TaxID=2777116 RepID=A0A8S1GZB2_9PELO|nr:unnamed protein product [Caenorhabditis auriculariae]
MTSLLRMIAQIAVAEHLRGQFDDKTHIKRCIKLYLYNVPINYRSLFDLILDPSKDFPEPNEFAFFVNTWLNIPSEVLMFHDEFAAFASYHLLRNSAAVPKNSKRAQGLLLKEVDALKTSIKKCGHLERCVVAAFQKLLEDCESSIQAVHRLMSVVSRSLSDESLKELINPLVDLLQCETSVKLLDRRFLLSISISYGAQTFLELFLPPIVEALASRQQDRSIVAKESITWLSKRYGPVVCARFISANLLRILASCYEGLELFGQSQEPDSVFRLTLCGEEYGSRVEAALSEIVITYSVTFVTVQYLPFCVDLIDQYSRRTTALLEAGLVSVFRITRLSIKTMTDHQLMNFLEDFIMNKIIHRALMIVLNNKIQFSSVRVRNIIICKAISLLQFTSQRIGAENARLYAKLPFELLFTTFSELYTAADDLQITGKKRNENDTIYHVPLWIVQEVIERFASEWGVPFLSSFCSEPAFLVPFVSNNASHSPLGALSTSTTTLKTYALNSMSSGNRIFSSSSSSPVSSYGGVSSFESGALSAVWCARVSAAVCGMRTALRFDHLSLCSFTGHSGAVRRIVAISNENSFVSASADKTVKLWSVKPEQDSVECQSTYRNHSKSLNDVVILSDNAIASADGTLHVWDPFRSSIVAQLDWDSDGNIIALESIDRHTLAAISSLHPSVKLFDTRVGRWTSELKVSPVSGVARAIASRQSGRQMTVGLSNGTVVVLDGRTGKIAYLAHGHTSHINGMHWLDSNDLLVCDADDPAIVMNVKPRLQLSRKLVDAVTAAGVQGTMLATLQSNSMLRIYNGSDLNIETKIRSDELPGTPTAILPLPLNSTFLLVKAEPETDEKEEGEIVEEEFNVKLEAPDELDEILLEEQSDEEISDDDDSEEYCPESGEECCESDEELFAELGREEQDDVRVKAPAVKRKKQTRERKRRALVRDDTTDAHFQERICAIPEINSSDKECKKVYDELKVNKDSWDRLYGYQKKGVRWLARLYSKKVGGILADEMGLGKTIQVRMIHDSKRDEETRNFVIVSPATLIAQWVAQFHKWAPEFRVFVLHGSGSYKEKYKTASSFLKKITSDPLSKTRVVITTYSTFLKNSGLMSDVEWNCAILDEGHLVKNPNAQITMNIKRIETPCKFLLTGSPVQNKLEELWSLIDMIFPGRLGTLQSFTEKFIIPISQGGYTTSTKTQKTIAYECAKVLKVAVEEYILRRMKTDVQSSLQLPTKMEQVVFCELTELQTYLYNQYLLSDECLKIMSRQIDPFIGITALRKLCNHPDIYKGDGEEATQDYGEVEKSGKMIVLYQLLKKWKKQKLMKVLVFSQSREVLKILGKLLERKKFVYLTMDGTTTVNNRQAKINQFNEDPKISVFLLTTKVGGVGLNLTAANKVVIFDPDWNPSTDSQAKERAWRIGQSRTVEIYRLLLSGTIEEKIYQRQIHKEFLSKRVLKDARQTQIMSRAVLRELFALHSASISGTETGALVSGETVERQKKTTEAAAKTKSKEEDFIMSQVLECANVRSVIKHDDLVGESLLSFELMQSNAKLIAQRAADSVAQKPVVSAFREQQSSFASKPPARGKKRSGLETMVMEKRKMDYANVPGTPQYNETTKQKIEEFLNSTLTRSATSNQIVEHFCVGKYEQEAFRRVLTGICRMDPKSKRWRMKNSPI